MRHFVYPRHITPQPIRAPELPDGSVIKSSGAAWITTVLPIISETVKRSVYTALKANPSFEKSGGRSPA